VKKATPSHRHAKEWARESPGSPDVVDRALPFLKAEQDGRRHLDEDIDHGVPNWEQPPLPKENIVNNSAQKASFY